MRAYHTDIKKKLSAFHIGQYVLISEKTSRYVRNFAMFPIMGCPAVRNQEGRLKTTRDIMTSEFALPDDATDGTCHV